MGSISWWQPEQLRPSCAVRASSWPSSGCRRRGSSGSPSGGGGGTGMHRQRIAARRRRGGWATSSTRRGTARARKLRVARGSRRASARRAARPSRNRCPAARRNAVDRGQLAVDEGVVGGRGSRARRRRGSTPRHDEEERLLAHRVSSGGGELGEERPRPWVPWRGSRMLVDLVVEGIERGFRLGCAASCSASVARMPASSSTAPCFRGVEERGRRGCELRRKNDIRVTSSARREAPHRWVVRVGLAELDDVEEVGRLEQRADRRLDARLEARCTPPSP